MGKIVLITGGTSGIGRQTALALIEKGCTVYELSRREKGVEGMHHISADVTDEEAVKNAVDFIVEKEGRIDIAISNAGFGISGAIEFTSTEDAKRLFDVNFFGMVNVNRFVLPVMRKQGGGRIVNLSSVGAPVALPFQAYYSATKSAVNSYTLALANEVRPFNITVCAVQPGDISTGFTDARDKIATGDDIYEGRIEKSVSRMENDERNGMSPDIAGRFIADKALKEKVKPIYTIGLPYKTVVFLVKHLPVPLSNRIIGKLYA